MTAWGGATPRRWQPEALAEVRRAVLSGCRAPLVHACTGAGKSVFLAELAATRGRVLVTTPTQNLVRQLSDTLSARFPGEVGRAYQHAWEVDRRIVVTCHASLPVVAAGQHDWATWIADEAHKLEGDELRTMRDSVRRKLTIGLTATPFRADGRSLVWERQVYSYPAAQAVEDGVLVPWRWVRLGEDCQRDHTGAPDVDANVVGWVAEAEGPGIVSAMSIVDAESFAERLTLAKLPARAIHSRMAESEQQARIGELRAGLLRCLVHVQLLSEGVDLPWLRWLALRRRVASPVRLVQEVGRVLRVAPGKTEAVLYDPHALSASIGLTHASQIDAILSAEPDAPEAPAEDPVTIPELVGLGELSTMPPGVVVPRLEGWIIDLHASLTTAGIIQPRGTAVWTGGTWRTKSASTRQREAIEKAKRWRGRLPDQRHRDAVDWLAARPDLSAGTASDLLDVLISLAGQCRVHGFRWMLRGELVPPLE